MATNENPVAQAQETIQAANDGDTISKLAGMSDEELASVLGLTAKFENAKVQIKEMNGLQGEGRKYAEERLSDMLTPRVYDLEYITDEAKRRSKKKQTGKEALCDCSPSSVLD